MNRRIAALVPVAALVVLPVSIASAGPAAAARACPAKWTQAATSAVPTGARAAAERIDNAGNDDGQVCYKAVHGRGNTGAGYNVKDNTVGDDA